MVAEKEVPQECVTAYEEQEKHQHVEDRWKGLEDLSDVATDSTAGPCVHEEDGAEGARRPEVGRLTYEDGQCLEEHYYEGHALKEKEKLLVFLWLYWSLTYCEIYQTVILQ